MSSPGVIRQWRDRVFDICS